MSPIAAVGLAIGLFGMWMLATWLLEGRIRTFQRPDAPGARLAYALVANLLIGTGGAALVIRLILRSGTELRPIDFGVSSPVRTAAYLPMALALGLLTFGFQHPAARRIAVVVNGFAQTLVVSIAEVLVCWSVVGVTVSHLPLEPGRAVFAGLAVAAAAFGLYHLAHSPPFNTLRMVAQLCGIGLLTGGFFFLVRDVVATVVLHNFFALTGVTRALESSGGLEAYRRFQPRLIGIAVVSIVWLMVLEQIVIRGGVPG